MSMIAVGVGAAVGAVIGIAGAIEGQQMAQAAANKARAQEMQGAKGAYAMTEASVNLQKGANREAAMNAIGELLRVGAAQDNRVKKEIEAVTSTMSASNEGITSGRSKGRQMIALQVKGTQAVLESKSQTAGSISQITDQMDKASNDLNNKLLSDWQQMATVLSTPTAVYHGSNLQIIQGGMAGASQGASIGSMFSGGAAGAAGAAGKAKGAIG